MSWTSPPASIKDPDEQSQATKLESSLPTGPRASTSSSSHLAGVPTVRLPLPQITIGRPPPALVRLPLIPAGQTATYAKAESVSDGDLSDFSFNDTDDEDDDSRNGSILNGHTSDGELQ